MQFCEHLFEVGNATLLDLSSLAGFTCPLVKTIPILRPSLYSALCCRERFARLLGNGFQLNQSRRRLLELSLPVIEPLSVDVEMLSSLLEVISRLIEISLQLATPFLRVLERLLDTRHFATDRVVLFLSAVERLSRLCLL